MPKKPKISTLTSIGNLASINKLLPHHSHGGKKEVHEKQKSKLEESKESLNKKIKVHGTKKPMKCWHCIHLITMWSVV